MYLELVFVFFSINIIFFQCQNLRQIFYTFQDSESGETYSSLPIIREERGEEVVAFNPIPGTSKSYLIDSEEVDIRFEKDTQFVVVPQAQIWTAPGLKSELNEILNCVEGRTILNFYKENQKLNESLRNELVHIIIQKESRNPDNESRLQITSNRFVQLSRAIVDTFPSEKAVTYYKPYSNNSPANGKLFSKYENYKKKYYIKSKDKKKNITQESDGDELNFLKNNLEPWSKIEQFWEITYEKRRNFDDIKIQNNIYEYFQLYPSLKLVHGYQLLEIDFGLKYPEKINCFKENGSLVLKKIYEHVIQLKKKDPDVTNLLLMYDQYPDLITLLILPYLLKISYGRKRSGDRTIVKHTKREISDSFILLVSVSIRIFI